jgi:heterodisulfide reductase subunit A-like polyferredoxin
MDGAAGVPGDFRVWLSGNDDIVEKSVGAIVVASELVVCPMNEAYGLELSDTVISQSQLEATLADNPAAFAGKSSLSCWDWPRTAIPWFWSGC